MKEVRIDPLTRVEGLGRVILYTEGRTLKDVRLEIFEPPRFFEKLLVGKKPDQVIDTVARICGLCPVAYQLTAVEAFEGVFNVKVPSHIKRLRRALYCGEWISSHSAHIFFLHLPDFFGKESFLELAKEKKEVLDAGITLRKAGNSILELLGGRHIHPVNLRVGGFYRLPSEAKIHQTLSILENALPVAESLLDEFKKLEFPNFERERVSVSLGEADNYPITEGSIVSSEGLRLNKSEYEEYFEEYQLPHSTALYSRFKNGETYEVGALARVKNNFHKLPPDLRDKVKGHLPTNNPYKSLLARMVEVIYALRESKNILERLEEDEPFVEYDVKEGEGIGITEAPRGLLFHRYVINKRGEVEVAKIVPPTSQNQKAMEGDVFLGIKTLNGDHQVTAERLIRNFDPCISCASHFIEVFVE
ncbi:coenzyme F420-reducing hydrogenase alpha subunit [Hydrogenivirga caldilitoris]|uniref:Coenzyme F420-reducing hydrogenase alpha subunit n=1 Tax=Hydrogenivirga caldilitoris TaxID=246264 RepID=A0A497XNE1_9AQUI|nr:coenzyme F420-reducing hydrogenase alpha subunit [Hydrogenivirga caldilitoris]